MTTTIEKILCGSLGAIKPAEKMNLSEWANSYLKLPATSAEPGQYKTARTPYVEEIMDSFTSADVHKIVVKSAAQVGKTSILMSIVGYYAHLDPANIMIILPTLEQAQDFSKDRLERMIQDTKVLTPLFYDLGKTRTANQTILSKFFRGGRLVLQGANSPAGLASRPIRILLCDETDRFPISAGSEGDPISLAEKRQTTYWNYKTGLFSTPTVEGESRIDAEYRIGTQEQWQHCCPNCGEYHFLDYRQMVVDFEETVDEHKNKTVLVKSVKWRCPDCGMEFDEMRMRNAKQKYIAQNPDAIKNSIRSFWINGFSSAWLSWKLIMREWLEARGNPARESVVFNTRFGKSYRLTGEFNDENIFLQRRESYPAELPEGVLLLTGSVDVQANRLEYEICGWGVGEQCYGIVRGIIRGEPNDAATWQGLDSVMDREYFFANGTALLVARCFIDSGYATKSVYEYCRYNRHKGRFAIKGSGAVGIPLLYKYANPKGAGVILTILGVNDGKQEVFSRLAIDAPGNMYFHFPVDDEFLKRGYDEVYFKQLISEKKVVRKSGGLLNVVWEPVSAGVRNESLDLRVYNIAAMKSCIGNLGETFWTRQAQSLKTPVRKTEERKTAVTEKVPVTRQINIW